MSKRTSETLQVTWVGEAQRDSLCLCYAGLLAEKRKSAISGKRHRPKPISWEKFGKLGDEEGEPGIERRRSSSNIQ